MKPTIMTARINDQRLRLVNETLIASGGVDEVQIRFEFCALWDGGGKVAVFYRDPSKVYHVPIADGLATVPHEVLANEGYFYLGVMGVAGNVRTTEAIRVYVAQGAITVPTEESREPTPDIYQQILAAYGQLDTELAVQRGRLNEVIAMRSADGMQVWEFDDPEGSSPKVSGTLKSNGAMVEVDLFFENCNLEPYISLRWHGLPVGATPFCETDLTATYEPWLKVKVSDRDQDDELVPTLFITDDNGGTDTCRVTGVYPLKSLSISELADVRVGADGTVYPTAGEAVRAAAQSGGAGGGGEQLGDIDAALDAILAIQAELMGGDA